jgi:hypothetical protein
VTAKREESVAMLEWRARSFRPSVDWGAVSWVWETTYDLRVAVAFDLYTR